MFWFVPAMLVKQPPAAAHRSLIQVTRLPMPLAEGLTSVMLPTPLAVWVTKYSFFRALTKDGVPVPLKPMPLMTKPVEATGLLAAFAKNEVAVELPLSMATAMV